jgi:Co/Zn/Cd efflux system component/copper chaperone CopZ
MTTDMAIAPETVRYHVTGMDCTDCVAKIEKATRMVAGIEDVRVSLTSQVMTLRLQNGSAPLAQVEQTVTGLGYQLDRLDGQGGDADAAPSASHLTPGYKRALWIVVLLNAGYGVIEMVGGFLSDSQALKADALDFMGDGLISFLGLLAIAWRPVWRARSALIQGIFLGTLGVFVLASTIYRVAVQEQPEAELMGAFGLVALVVNVAAALLLLPHRSGDANARAVWLFSRNDALGNLAVVIAAGFVAWLDSPWPDLVVAFVIAGLFLQSSWAIVKDARNELSETGR